MDLNIFLEVLIEEIILEKFTILYSMDFFWDGKKILNLFDADTSISRRSWGIEKKLNKMSIEFYYIGCHRPIVLSSQ